MKKQWTVTAADGMNHVIEYKGRSLLVDGQKYPLKSSNWFIQLIDYAINFGETQCRLVVMGNKVDLAVNGRYLGSGELISLLPACLYTYPFSQVSAVCSAF